jgi:hypothetical protein
MGRTYFLKLEEPDTKAGLWSCTASYVVNGDLREVRAKGLTDTHAVSEARLKAAKFDLECRNEPCSPSR